MDWSEWLGETGGRRRATNIGVIGLVEVSLTGRQIEILNTIKQ